MVTLRVYDGGKRYDASDRYTLYYPTPRNKVAEMGCKGMYVGFNFTKEDIIQYCHGECKFGVGIDFFGGKKIKRETLPMHVQEWINRVEKEFNEIVY